MQRRRAVPSPKLIANSIAFVRRCFADSDDPPSEEQIVRAGNRVALNLAFTEDAAFKEHYGVDRKDEL